ncbi:nuclear transcription factor Y subunit A-1-like isoform X3 [Mangifera indica]|uniref:nuclear transcription factor Y subunit A-1-like isoform X3 n=1 Tax=Mangifera indica TaxID=29780 RepID=UPI001CF99CFA|nr:nuclear transcription factor Y subunit A-1-like isoform X3 [Mangifera indica]XP_044468127.1 nuclear transcription factor Y subunit A-1-like isoform X3 [Mangifera indica]
MHQNPNSTNNPGPATNSNKTHIVSSHPWWRGIGHDGFSQNMLGESMTDITTEQQANGDSGSKTSKLQVKSGPDEGTEANREIKVIAMSQSDGKFGEQQSQQYTASIVHQPVGECVTPPTQLELVRHNIACVSYPFSDSYYGGVVPACGPQALVHSHCVGLQQARMALPLEMAEEPVYVNAKQYHGILRRRQIRAKAELEKKLIKVRKLGISVQQGSFMIIY